MLNAVEVAFLIDDTTKTSLRFYIHYAGI